MRKYLGHERSFRTHKDPLQCTCSRKFRSRRSWRSRKFAQCMYPRSSKFRSRRSGLLGNASQCMSPCSHKFRSQRSCRRRKDAQCISPRSYGSVKMNHCYRCHETRCYDGSCYCRDGSRFLSRVHCLLSCLNRDFHCRLSLNRDVQIFHCRSCCGSWSARDCFHFRCCGSWSARGCFHYHCCGSWSARGCGCFHLHFHHGLNH